MITHAIATREPISLEDVIANAALQTRVDKKFLLTRAEFNEFAEGLGECFKVMQIDQRRLFTYHSTYYDTPDFEQYRAHRQGRRRRYKVRSRTYVDTGLQMFEIKTKGLRGTTVKHRTEGEFDIDFVEEVLGEQPLLQPALDSRYERATFVDPDDGERVTCDINLHYDDGVNQVAGPELVVVETKSADGRGVSDRTLASMGIRPVSMSKYCIGVALLNPELPANKWVRVLDRFTPAGTPYRAR